MLIAAACSSGGGRGGSGDGGERDGVADGSDDGGDAAGSSSGATDATGTGSGGSLDAPTFGPDGCALLNTPCTQGSQCCSGSCPIPQLVCTLPPNHP
jgi:hypothetical protein